MKKLLLATFAVAAFMGGSASAADMRPSYKAPPPYVPPCAQFGGFYVGGNVGSVTHDWKWNDLDAWANNEVSVGLPLNTTSTKTGFTGGLQAGYNWQRGCSLFGFEADWNWAGLKRDKFHTDGQPGAALDTLNVHSELKWFGTVRTRAGVIVNDLLIYATGGLAYARIDRSFAVTDNIGGVFVTETFVDDRTRWGWTLGFGTEWALWNNWSLKSEVLYAKFTQREATFNSAFAVANGNAATKRFDYDDAIWTLRFGINYRFGGGPLYARN